jgi:thymidylate synthase (FAD)
MKQIKKIHLVPEARVELIKWTPDPDDHVYISARIAYSNKSIGQIKEELNDREKVRKFINMLRDKGHTSTFEHVSFTFLIEGCSRVCTHQLVRHRLASYTQQSQRYAGATGFFFLPDTIFNNPDALRIAKDVIDFTTQKYNELINMGIHQEDARYIIPQAVTSRITVTMNAWELLHFFELRTCMHAQKEIRMVAWKMLKEVQRIAPIIFENAGPPCISKMFCPEKDMKCPLYRAYIEKGGSRDD